MKAYIITLGFCPWRVLEAGLASYAATAAVKPSAHYFLDQHYPLRREENLPQLQRLCQQHGLTYVDSGQDRGLCGGWNFLIPQIPFAEGDILIGYDPDSKPESRGWDQALLDVLAAEPAFDLAATSQAHTAENIFPRGIIQGSFREVAGHRIFHVNMPTLDMWTVGAARWELFRGREMASSMAYWGGTEATVRSWLIERGKTYCYLMDHQENNGNSILGDPEYRQYKDDLIRGYRGSFAEWLSTKKDK